ncbi:GMC family oxidoreductase [Rhodopseudomonas sp. B29]|uniref:GMC family oxidoreductase n=1 Tax=Rhodopseudomonas sp. B29 TaxID=95607 RepID=UPI0003455AB4|nr:GMC family oxidoreductase [Rhodopseudomonas sp. B29]
MPRKLPRKDVVIIGLGWTGAILGYELATSGLDVVAIERGPWRDTANDFPPAYAPDELRYAVRLDLFLRTQQDTLTVRNKTNQTALPIRQFAGFLPGNGVGGAGVHWNGQTWRFLPTDFNLRSHLEQRYGKQMLPDDMTIQDWPVSYDELEPYYDRFEKLCGTSGKAGNLRGQILPGGNPFEGWRSSDYPTPPLKQNYGQTLFAEAARKTGHNPFPQPASNLSEAYTNPLGIRMGQCTYCGHCERFGCGNYSKSSPQTCVLPALMRLPNFSARTESEVTKINLDSTGKRATGVTYVDSSGEEWEQPADLVLVCAFSLFNVRLLLLSGIGTPYDPQTGQGVVGRNYAYQTTSSVGVILKDKILNPFIATGANGMMIDDYNGDNFDHSGLGFVGGGYMGAGQSNARPIQTHPVPSGTPKWGAAWKKAVAETYQSAMRLSTHGSSYSYRDCYLDLDPTYKDRFGRPLMRMTFDFHDNELKMSAYLTDRLAEIARALDPVELTATPRTGPYNANIYQTTHNTGGTVMGNDPATSVVNRYCQSWDVSNVFIPGGASVFPQNHGYNPTNTVGALAYWTADAIRNRYLKNPGPLG